MKCVIKNLLIMISFCTLTSCYERHNEEDSFYGLDFNVDHANYIDPFDMLNYDRMALKHSIVKPNPISPVDIITPVAEEVPINEEITKIQCPVPIVLKKENDCREQPFFKRFLRIMYSTMKLEVCVQFLFHLSYFKSY